MTSPTLLDIRCGAGGASQGYALAGFAVTGVDARPQKRYPFAFCLADPLTFLAARGGDYDAIHVSVMRRGPDDATITALRDALIAIGTPWVLEDVPTSPIRPDLMLCGCLFGLRLRRHVRRYETSWQAFVMRQPCFHTHPSAQAKPPWATIKTLRGVPVADRRDALGIPWMIGTELAMATPPVYTAYLGSLLRNVL